MGDWFKHMIILLCAPALAMLEVICEINDASWFRFKFSENSYSETELNWEIRCHFLEPRLTLVLFWSPNPNNFPDSLKSLPFDCMRKVWIKHWQWMEGSIILPLFDFSRDISPRFRFQLSSGFVGSLFPIYQSLTACLYSAGVRTLYQIARYSPPWTQHRGPILTPWSLSLTFEKRFAFMLFGRPSKPWSPDSAQIFFCPGFFFVLRVFETFRRVSLMRSAALPSLLMLQYRPVLFPVTTSRGQ
jgi:hypothetical protein